MDICLKEFAFDSIHMSKIVSSIFFCMCRYLDGYARFYRQTIMLSSYLNPGKISCLLEKIVLKRHKLNPLSLCHVLVLLCIFVLTHMWTSFMDYNSGTLKYPILPFFSSILIVRSRLQSGHVCLSMWLYFSYLVSKYFIKLFLYLHLFHLVCQAIQTDWWFSLCLFLSNTCFIVMYACEQNVIVVSMNEQEIKSYLSTYSTGQKKLYCIYNNIQLDLEQKPIIKRKNESVC